MQIFITGGAGFIGCNAAVHFLRQGHHVTLFDNLSRPKSGHNVAWLQYQNWPAPAKLQIVLGDIRNAAELAAAMSQAAPDLVLHLAAQVAVTTSVTSPREDFEINALGTFNVLEAARQQMHSPAVFYASSNKVYGGMEDIVVLEGATAYRYRDFPAGISEQQSLDFHSPYGCSKGTGDQYVRDYARIYGLKTVVFRQSAIYGERQFGVEDQGWLAHFIIATVLGKPISIYGNGKQVRDMLHVSDLVRAYDLAWRNLDVVSGEILNVGGGAENTLSVWAECGPLLEKLAQRPIQVNYGDWRPGDQPCYISNNAKITQMLGWQPQVTVQDGVERLWQWVNNNRDLF